MHAGASALVIIESGVGSRDSSLENHVYYSLSFTVLKYYRQTDVAGFYSRFYSRGFFSELSREPCTVRTE